MFGTKETKLKSSNQIHETLTPLSELNGPSKVSDVAEKAPIAVSRISSPANTPRDKIEPKNETGSELKKLIVGRGISLSGKISACDRLVIEGNVEAELESCHTLEVAESGMFKGAAEINAAEISGQYEGSLTVRENLLIRGTGRVSGTVRYGRLHIENGGEINGDFKKGAATRTQN